MEDIVSEIVELELNKKSDSIEPILNLGLVNYVYDVTCGGENYIVRINKDIDKEFEFWKEKWCLEQVTALGVQSPKVLKIGVKRDFPFMVMNKIEGINGSQCSPKEKLHIWKKLGEYAHQFHEIKQIEKLHIETDEFHDNWSSKLAYNINQLSSEDSLLTKNVFSKKDHQNVRNFLIGLTNKKFIQGLVHGDLCPRNVICKDENVFLLDWGSSKIDIVPHTEIGTVLMDNHLNEHELKSFLVGLKISEIEYNNIKEEIKHINLLNRLDLYRWAEGNAILEIEEYIEKLVSTYHAALI